MRNLPIGVFDSGIGGLTVVKEIIKQLPHENIIYLGDTARVPYGIRGSVVIQQFAEELTRYLVHKKVKCIVVACNTISATSIPQLKKITTLPIIDVISPSAEKIVQTTKTNRVGIIGTSATIGSTVYDQLIKKLNPKVNITKRACPLFVPIAEEGLADSNVAELTARYYLSDIKNIDTLHLGCTHYPLLKPVIQKTVGKNIAIIDSAKPTAEKLKEILREKDLLNTSKKKGCIKLNFTDVHERIYETGKWFLNMDVSGMVKRVSI